MKGLHVGADGFRLDAALTEDVIAIVGRRGRGKTTTAVVLVEELHDAGARFCVADPVGVWWGLKSSKDGRSAGIPVVVMGGEHADVPLEDTAGRVIADFVADPTGPSVVLDFRGFRKGQMTRFMTDFLEQLYHRNRAPLHLVLDEADQFAPQRVMGETARLVGAAEDVCKMGRAKGLHPIVITQRPAAINKNVLTQAGLLVAHALTGPQDQKAVDEWIRANADEAQRGKFMETIAGLEKGVAWFWQPEIPIFQRVHVRNRETFDSSATPKRGEARAAPKVLAEVDLEELKKRIAGTIEKAKAQDPRELQRRVAELERQLRAAAAARPSPAEKPARTITKRVPAVDPKLTARVEKALERFEEDSSRVLAGVAGRLEKIREGLDALASIVARRVPAEIAAAPAPAAAPRNASPALHPVPRRSVAPLPAQPARPRPVAPPANDGAPLDLGPGQPRLVATAAIYGRQGGLSRRALALRAVMSPGGGTFKTYLPQLIRDGLLQDNGGHIQVTAAGLATLDGTPQLVPADPEQLRATWRAELADGGQRRIFDALVQAYPDWITRTELGARAGVEATGGTFKTYFPKLVRLGLVDVVERGQVRASGLLFGA
jgi:hypothetical protein